MAYCGHVAIPFVIAANLVQPLQLCRANRAPPAGPCGAAQLCSGALSQPDWMQQCHQHLENNGKCELLAEPGDAINEAIATLLVTPVEMYGLFFYPRVSALRRHNNDAFAMIEIPEAIQ